MVLPAVVAHDMLPANPSLGVPGFPDCRRVHPELDLHVEEAALDLVCTQRAGVGAIKIGCVGDSITAGAHSSGGTYTYPGQLQILLDQTHGADAYSVTNLGACGSTMLKKGNSPYWSRPQYETLIANTWDIIVILLGTNDAKDISSSGGSTDNWQHDCGGVDGTTLEGCSFAADYEAMVKVIRTLGTSPQGPTIYAAIPPPLMRQGVYSMNQTVINSVFPKLVPLIQQDSGILGPIDVFTGMGGMTDWQTAYPAKGCVINNSQPDSCKWYCDGQSCDQCHPNDNGYTQLATIVQEGLGLTGVVSV